MLGAEVVDRHAHPGRIQLVQALGGEVRLAQQIASATSSTSASGGTSWVRSAAPTRSSSCGDTSSRALMLTCTDRGPPAAVRRRSAFHVAEVATGEVEHALAERDDRAGLLGQRDEPVGLDRAERRVLPAGERLVADELAGLEAEQRLVGDGELVAVDGRRATPARARRARRTSARSRRRRR